MLVIYVVLCSVVVVHIIWFYTTIVVVVISFSIIVSCTFISLLLVTPVIVHADMSTSSDHTKAFVQCCHGKHTVASSRT